jgi:hypothetical protein
MRTRHFAAIAGVVLAGSVVATAVANAASGPAPSRVDPVAMAQSLRHQLADARVYQFAISVDGRLEATGEHGDPSPLAAVAALRNGAQGGDAVSCHATFGGGVEAVLLVNAGATDTQPCGLLGVADAAASSP